MPTRLRAVIVILAGCSALVVGAAVTGRLISAGSPVVALASGGDIWVADLSRGLTRNLTASEIVDDAPSWSPDGRHIAFATIRNSPASRPQREIAIYDLRRGSTRIVTENAAWDDSPVWSPDGGAIAFRSDRDSHTGMGLYLIDLAHLDAAPRLLVRDAAVDLVPSWSHDSAALIVMLTVDGSRQVVAVDAASGVASLLLGRAAFYPRLSPDGTHLAAWLPAVNGYALSVGSIGEPLRGISGVHMNPAPFAWSPDAGAIIYASTEGAEDVLERVDVASGEITVAYTPPARVTGLSWRP